MRGVWPALIGLAVLAVAGLGAAGAAGLVDTVVAEVGASPIMLSDVTLARALGVLGLEPSDGPVTDAELGRYLDAQLVLREAAQLDIEVPSADVERAWAEAGGAGLARRLDTAGVEPSWARRLLEANLRVERFVDLRFRDFAFVTDFDVDEALGPGAHDEATRARARDRLRADVVARAYAAWLEDARHRTPVRRIPDLAPPWPAPFSLGAPAAAR